MVNENKSSAITSIDDIRKVVDYLQLHKKEQEQILIMSDVDYKKTAEWIQSLASATAAKSERNIDNASDDVFMFHYGGYGFIIKKEEK